MIIDLLGCDTLCLSRPAGGRQLSRSTARALAFVMAAKCYHDKKI